MYLAGRSTFRATSGVLLRRLRRVLRAPGGMPFRARPPSESRRRATAVVGPLCRDHGFALGVDRAAGSTVGQHPGGGRRAGTHRPPPRHGAHLVYQVTGSPGHHSAIPELSASCSARSDGAVSSPPSASRAAPRHECNLPVCCCPCGPVVLRPEPAEQSRPAAGLARPVRLLGRGSGTVDQPHRRPPTGGLFTAHVFGHGQWGPGSGVALSAGSWTPAYPLGGAGGNPLRPLSSARPNARCVVTLTANDRGEAVARDGTGSRRRPLTTSLATSGTRPAPARR